jgi:soluble lytic murein transglycosylase-like protein
MKKFLPMIFLLTAFFLLPSNKVQASCETPVAGISKVLTEYGENPTELHIAYYSAIYKVDSELVQAVIDGESEGRADAINYNRNGTHDTGLMQINSCNHNWLREELGITDFYDPRQNIQCGCYILGLLSRKYESVNRILMSYNMGESRTSQLWERGIYSSSYSRKVVRKLNQIRRNKK